MTTLLAPEGTQVRHEQDGARLASHRLELRVVSGSPGEWAVPAPRLVVGSAPTCDVVLDDVTVSRHHCEIVVRDQRYVLRDLDSTNGTFVGGQEILEAWIEPGALVRVGDTELVFQPKKKFVRLGASTHGRFGDLVGTSPAMRALFGVLERVAPTGLSCIVLGETGTGKELAARGLHAASSRARGPFVVVDCAAVSPNLVEAELFGHERGAYTSADRARPGAFELAAKGTLFLDEVGELPLELQPKLLRALERREVKRLGAAQITDVDVRVVAATHRDLLAMVNDGTFREDLYYRLAEVVVAIPPLRERREDVEPITAELIRVESTGDGAAFELTSDAATALAERDWPGNVRELRNTLRRAMALGGGPRLTAADFALGQNAVRAEIPRTLPSSAATDIVDEWWSLPLREAREAWGRKLDRAYLVRLMDRCAGNEERAASESGVHVKSLQRLLRQHGLRRT